MSKFIDLATLIEYYKKGFFPMANSSKDNNISFYKPLKRFIIPINNFHIPKKLFNLFKNNNFIFKINYDFEKVINLCKNIQRKNQDTWINNIIINTYLKLHYTNKCHSVECYDNNSIVGGLYGVHLGSSFFGESMFSLKNNTSKMCLLYLIAILKKNNFKLLDSQFYNPHLIQFGAYEISNNEYDLILKNSLKNEKEFKELSNFQEVLSVLQSISHKS